MRASTTSDRTEPASAPSASWLHPLLILLVVVLGYGLGQGRLPLIGEETCRALHGIEMAATGDWLVPTNQGVAILDRPPLHYWALALVQRFVHPLDPLTLRLTMAAVTLATALVVWAYARRVLAPAGALVAALAYPTMGHVFDLGRRAETDGPFALLLAVALLLWHHGYAQGWRPLATWCASCAAAALATLIKGTQAPIAFFGAIYAFALLRRDWRFLLSRAHAAGLLVFVALVGAFQVPFFLRAGWEGTRQTWLDPFTDRVDTDLLALAEHLVTFPFEVLGACLPWSLLAIGLLQRGFWRGSERVRSSVLFLLVGCAAIFTPVWLSEGGKTRYVMALYPLLAIVCGAVVDRALQADAPPALRRLWSGYLRGLAALVLAAAAGLLAVTLASGPAASETLRKLAQPTWLTIAFLAAAGANVALVLRLPPGPPQARATLHTFALAALVAIGFNGPALNASAFGSDRVGAEVAALRERLPDPSGLVSFGMLHHKFLYYWYLEGDTIPILERPRRPAQVPADLDYFALRVEEGEEPKLPFEWEEFARIDTDPKRRTRVWVVVGRRLDRR